MTTNKKPPFSDAEVISMYKAMRCTALSRNEYINTLDETERDILLVSAQCCKMIIANAEYWINRMAEEDK